MALGLPRLWLLPGPRIAACGAGGAGPLGPERLVARAGRPMRVLATTGWPQGLEETDSSSLQGPPGLGPGQVCLLDALGRVGGELGLGWPLCPLPTGRPPGRADPLSVGRAPTAHSLGSKGGRDVETESRLFLAWKKTYGPSLLTRREKLAGGRKSCRAASGSCPGRGAGLLLPTLYCPPGAGEDTGCFPHQSQFRYTRFPPRQGRICFPGWGVNAQWHPLTGLVGGVSPGPVLPALRGCGCFFRPSASWAKCALLRLRVWP